MNLRDLNSFTQSNEITFASPIGSEWNLIRKSTAGMSASGDSRNATLKVIAQPGGIQVYVDDKFKGSTSEKEGVLVVENLSAGSAKVRLSEKGFVDFTQNVTLAAGETAKLETNLAPEGPEPLGEPEIEEALKNGVPKTRIMGLVTSSMASTSHSLTSWSRTCVPSGLTATCCWPSPKARNSFPNRVQRY